jgi:hypothetical protein
MRPLYAIQFEVAPRDSSPQLDVTDEVLRSVASWIAEWYLFRKRSQIVFPIGGGRIAPVHDHEVVVSRALSAKGEVSHCLVSWSYPDDLDGNLLWHTRCEISTFNGLTEFSLQLLLESIQFYIAPVDFNLKRPRVVATLLRQFACVHGDTRLSMEPRGLSAESVPKFVQTRLLSSSRRLPIVMVSRTSLSDKWLVDPGELADRLAGIAEVYVLDDKWAGYALSEEVGKLYSCYNGAVRLYWPNFSLTEAPYSPVYLPERATYLGSRLIENIFRQLAAISAFRFLPGPVTVDALESLQTERANELDLLKKAAHDSNDYGQLLELSDEENRQLRDKAQQLEKDNEDLRTRLQLSQENLKSIWQAQEPEDQAASDEIIRSEDEPELENVEAAVCAAQLKFGDTLLFQESAFESANDSPFKQPKKVLHALLAMHEVCLAWRQSRKTKTPIGTWEQQFIKKGLTYKARESMTSKGKWAEEYETVYKGNKVSIEQHLALGKAGPDTCLRIHFYVDEDSQKFVVAHVGRHKTNTSS